MNEQIISHEELLRLGFERLFGSNGFQYYRNGDFELRKCAECDFTDLEYHSKDGIVKVNSIDQLKRLLSKICIVQDDNGSYWFEMTYSNETVRKPSVRDCLIRLGIDASEDSVTEWAKLVIPY